MKKPRHDALVTQARIIAAAERLFAERGIDSVTVSEINRAAGQRNASALQYHFGGKEGLIHAIFDKHTPGIEQRRHAMLDDLEAADALELRDLVEALVLPVAAKLEDPDGGVAFVCLNAQLVGHPKFPLLELAAQRVNSGRDRLQRLVARTHPEVSSSLWLSRWLLMLCLLFHGLADYARLTAREPSDLPLPDRQVFVRDLIDAIVAVAAAPLPG